MNAARVRSDKDPGIFPGTSDPESPCLKQGPLQTENRNLFCPPRLPPLGPYLCYLILGYFLHVDIMAHYVGAFPNLLSIRVLYTTASDPSKSRLD